MSITKGLVWIDPNYVHADLFRSIFEKFHVFTYPSSQFLTAELQEHGYITQTFLKQQFERFCLNHVRSLIRNQKEIHFYLVLTSISIPDLQTLRQWLYSGYLSGITEAMGNVPSEQLPYWKDVETWLRSRSNDLPTLGELSELFIASPDDTPALPHPSQIQNQRNKGSNNSLGKGNNILTSKPKFSSRPESWNTRQVVIDIIDPIALLQSLICPRKFFGIGADIQPEFVYPASFNIQEVESQTRTRVESLYSTLGKSSMMNNITGSFGSSSAVISKSFAEYSEEDIAPVQPFNDSPERLTDLDLRYSPLSFPKQLYTFLPSIPPITHVATIEHVRDAIRGYHKRVEVFRKQWRAADGNNNNNPPNNLNNAKNRTNGQYPKHHFRIEIERINPDQLERIDKLTLTRLLHDQQVKMDNDTYPRWVKFPGLLSFKNLHYQTFWKTESAERWMEPLICSKDWTPLSLLQEKSNAVGNNNNHSKLNTQNALNDFSYNWKPCCVTLFNRDTNCWEMFNLEPNISLATYSILDKLIDTTKSIGAKLEFGTTCIEKNTLGYFSLFTAMLGFTRNDRFERNKANILAIGDSHHGNNEKYIVAAGLDKKQVQLGQPSTPRHTTTTDGRPAIGVEVCTNAYFLLAIRFAPYLQWVGTITKRLEYFKQQIQSITMENQSKLNKSIVTAVTNPGTKRGRKGSKASNTFGSSLSSFPDHDESQFDSLFTPQLQNQFDLATQITPHDTTTTKPPETYLDVESRNEYHTLQAQSRELEACNALVSLNTIKQWSLFTSWFQFFKIFVTTGFTTSKTAVWPTYSNIRLSLAEHAALIVNNILYADMLILDHTIDINTLLTEFIKIKVRAEIQKKRTKEQEHALLTLKRKQRESKNIHDDEHVYLSNLRDDVKDNHDNNNNYNQQDRFDINSDRFNTLASFDNSSAIPDSNLGFTNSSRNTPYSNSSNQQQYDAFSDMTPEATFKARWTYYIGSVICYALGLFRPPVHESILYGPDQTTSNSDINAVDVLLQQPGKVGKQDTEDFAQTYLHTVTKNNSLNNNNASTSPNDESNPNSNLKSREEIRRKNQLELYNKGFGIHTVTYLDKKFPDLAPIGQNLFYTLQNYPTPHPNNIYLERFTPHLSIKGGNTMNDLNNSVVNNTHILSPPRPQLSTTKTTTLPIPTSLDSNTHRVLDPGPMLIPAPKRITMTKPSSTTDPYWSAAYHLRERGFYPIIPLLSKKWVDTMIDTKGAIVIGNCKPLGAGNQLVNNDWDKDGFEEDKQQIIQGPKFGVKMSIFFNHLIMPNEKVLDNLIHSLYPDLESIQRKTQHDEMVQQPLQQLRADQQGKNLTIVQSSQYHNNTNNNSRLNVSNATDDDFDSSNNNFPQITHKQPSQKKSSMSDIDQDVDTSGEGKVEKKNQPLAEIMGFESILVKSTQNQHNHQPQNVQSFPQSTQSNLIPSKSRLQPLQPQEQTNSISFDAGIKVGVGKFSTLSKKISLMSPTLITASTVSTKPLSSSNALSQSKPKSQVSNRLDDDEEEDQVNNDDDDNHDMVDNDVDTDAVNTNHNDMNQNVALKSQKTIEKNNQNNTTEEISFFTHLATGDVRVGKSKGSASLQLIGHFEQDSPTKTIVTSTTASQPPAQSIPTSTSLSIAQSKSKLLMPNNQPTSTEMVIIISNDEDMDGKNVNKKDMGVFNHSDHVLEYHSSFDNKKQSLHHHHTDIQNDIDTIETTQMVHQITSSGIPTNHRSNINDVLPQKFTKITHAVLERLVSSTLSTYLGLELNHFSGSQSTDTVPSPQSQSAQFSPNGNSSPFMGPAVQNTPVSALFSIESHWRSPTPNFISEVSMDNSGSYSPKAFYIPRELLDLLEMIVDSTSRELQNELNLLQNSNLFSLFSSENSSLHQSTNRDKRNQKSTHSDFDNYSLNTRLNPPTDIASRALESILIQQKLLPSPHNPNVHQLARQSTINTTVVYTEDQQYFRRFQTQSPHLEAPSVDNDNTLYWLPVSHIIPHSDRSRDLLRTLLQPNHNNQLNNQVNGDMNDSNFDHTDQTQHFNTLLPSSSTTNDHYLPSPTETTTTTIVPGLFVTLPELMLLRSLGYGCISVLLPNTLQKPSYSKFLSQHFYFSFFHQFFSYLALQPPELIALPYSEIPTQILRPYSDSYPSIRNNGLSMNDDKSETNSTISAQSTSSTSSSHPKLLPFLQSRDRQEWIDRLLLQLITLMSISFPSHISPSTNLSIEGRNNVMTICPPDQQPNYPTPLRVGDLVSLSTDPLSLCPQTISLRLTPQQELEQLSTHFDTNKLTNSLFSNGGGDNLPTFQLINGHYTATRTSTTQSFGRSISILTPYNKEDDFTPQSGISGQPTIQRHQSAIFATNPSKSSSIQQPQLDTALSLIVDNNTTLSNTQPSTNQQTTTQGNKIFNIFSSQDWLSINSTNNGIVFYHRWLNEDLTRGAQIAYPLTMPFRQDIMLTLMRYRLMKYTTTSLWDGLVSSYHLSLNSKQYFNHMNMMITSNHLLHSSSSQSLSDNDLYYSPQHTKTIPVHNWLKFPLPTTDLFITMQLQGVIPSNVWAFRQQFGSDRSNFQNQPIPSSKFALLVPKPAYLYPEGTSRGPLFRGRHFFLCPGFTPVSTNLIRSLVRSQDGCMEAIYPGIITQSDTRNDTTGFTRLIWESNQSTTSSSTLVTSESSTSSTNQGALSFLQSILGNTGSLTAPSTLTNHRIAAHSSAISIRTGNTTNEISILSSSTMILASSYEQLCGWVGYLLYGPISLRFANSVQRLLLENASLGTSGVGGDHPTIGLNPYWQFAPKVISIVNSLITNGSVVHYQWLYHSLCRGEHVDPRDWALQFNTKELEQHLAQFTQRQQALYEYSIHQQVDLIKSQPQSVITPTPSPSTSFHRSRSTVLSNGGNDPIKSSSQLVLLPQASAVSNQNNDMQEIANSPLMISATSSSPRGTDYDDIDCDITVPINTAPTTTTTKPNPFRTSSIVVPNVTTNGLNNEEIGGNNLTMNPANFTTDFNTAFPEKTIINPTTATSNASIDLLEKKQQLRREQSRIGGNNNDGDDDNENNHHDLPRKQPTQQPLVEIKLVDKTSRPSKSELAAPGVICPNHYRPYSGLFTNLRFVILIPEFTEQVELKSLIEQHGGVVVPSSHLRQCYRGNFNWVYGGLKDYNKANPRSGLELNTTDPSPQVIFENCLKILESKQDINDQHAFAMAVLNNIQPPSVMFSGINIVICKRYHPRYHEWFAIAPPESGGGVPFPNFQALAVAANAQGQSNPQANSITSGLQRNGSKLNPLNGAAGSFSSKFGQGVVSSSQQPPNQFQNLSQKEIMDVLKMAPIGANIDIFGDGFIPSHIYKLPSVSSHGNHEDTFDFTMDGDDDNENAKLVQKPRKKTTKPMFDQTFLNYTTNELMLLRTSALLPQINNNPINSKISLMAGQSAMNGNNNNNGKNELELLDKAFTSITSQIADLTRDTYNYITPPSKPYNPQRKGVSTTKSTSNKGNNNPNQSVTDPSPLPIRNLLLEHNGQNPLNNSTKPTHDLLTSPVDYHPVESFIDSVVQSTASSSSGGINTILASKRQKLEIYQDAANIFAIHTSSQHDFLSGSIPNPSSDRSPLDIIQEVIGTIKPVPEVQKPGASSSTKNGPQQTDVKALERATSAAKTLNAHSLNTFIHFPHLYISTQRSGLPMCIVQPQWVYDCIHYGIAIIPRRTWTSQTYMDPRQIFINAILAILPSIPHHLLVSNFGLLLNIIALLSPTTTNPTNSQSTSLVNSIQPSATGLAGVLYDHIKRQLIHFTFSNGDNKILRRMYTNHLLTKQFETFSAVQKIEFQQENSKLTTLTRLQSNNSLNTTNNNVFYNQQLHSQMGQDGLDQTTPSTQQQNNNSLLKNLEFFSPKPEHKRHSNRHSDHTPSSNTNILTMSDNNCPQINPLFAVLMKPLHYMTKVLLSAQLTHRTFNEKCAVRSMNHFHPIISSLSSIFNLTNSFIANIDSSQRPHSLNIINNNAKAMVGYLDGLKVPLYVQTYITNTAQIANPTVQLVNDLTFLGNTASLRAKKAGKGSSTSKHIENDQEGKEEEEEEDEIPFKLIATTDHRHTVSNSFPLYLTISNTTIPLYSWLIHLLPYYNPKLFEETGSLVHTTYNGNCSLLIFHAIPAFDAIDHLIASNLTPASSKNKTAQGTVASLGKAKNTLKALLLDFIQLPSLESLATIIKSPPHPTPITSSSSSMSLSKNSNKVSLFDNGMNGNTGNGSKDLSTKGQFQPPNDYQIHPFSALFSAILPGLPYYDPSLLNDDIHHAIVSALSVYQIPQPNRMISITNNNNKMMTKKINPTTPPTTTELIDFMTHTAETLQLLSSTPALQNLYPTLGQHNSNNNNVGQGTNLQNKNNNQILDENCTTTTIQFTPTLGTHSLNTPSGNLEQYINNEIEFSGIYVLPFYTPIPSMKWYRIPFSRYFFNKKVYQEANNTISSTIPPTPNNNNNESNPQNVPMCITMLNLPDRSESLLKNLVSSISDESMNRSITNHLNSIINNNSTDNNNNNNNNNPDQTPLRPFYTPLPNFSQSTLDQIEVLINGQRGSNKLPLLQLRERIEALFTLSELFMIHKITHVVIYSRLNPQPFITTLYFMFHLVYPHIHVVNMYWIIESSRAGGPLLESFFSPKDFVFQDLAINPSSNMTPSSTSANSMMTRGGGVSNNNNNNNNNNPMGSNNTKR